MDIINDNMKFKLYNSIFFIAYFMFSFQKPKKLSLDKWEYVLVDSTRTENDIKKGWAWFGMDFSDANKDGYGDIVAGKWFYLNGKDNSGQKWVKSVIRDSVDNMFIVDVDGDEYADVIGLQCDKQYWFEAENKAHTKWRRVLIGTQSICNHKMSSMGYCKADIFKGGKEELLFTDLPGKIWCFQIPQNPKSLWPVTVISQNGATEKFIAAGDIDGDGDLDLATAYQRNDEKHYSGICWFQNPGNKKDIWKRFTIGNVDYTADHFAVADFNNDHIPEIIVTEGRSPEKYPAGIYLFKAPDRNIFNPAWVKIPISIQYSTNSLELADMDLDGDIDFVTGEHKGSCKLQIWENLGGLKFKEHIIDSLKESHNGTKLFDVEGDGDLDLASVGWYDYKYVHLWINKAIK